MSAHAPIINLSAPYSPSVQAGRPPETEQSSFRRHLGKRTGMAARTLWENKNQGDHRHCEDCSRSRAADLEPSIRHRLVKQVAERRPERSGENKGGPE